MPLWLLFNQKHLRCSKPSIRNFGTIFLERTLLLFSPEIRTFSDEMNGVILSYFLSLIFDLWISSRRFFRSSECDAIPSNPNVVWYTFFQWRFAFKKLKCWCCFTSVVEKTCISKLNFTTIWIILRYCVCWLNAFISKRVKLSSHHTQYRNIILMFVKFNFEMQVFSTTEV